MKKVILPIVAVLALAACEDVKKVSSKTEIVDSDKAARFIVDCAKAANPMSDEEGEDLVYQCELTAKKIYGATVYYIWHDYSMHCESKTVMEAQNCWDENKAFITGDLK